MHCMYLLAWTTFRSWSTFYLSTKSNLGQQPFFHTLLGQSRKLVLPSQKKTANQLCLCCSLTFLALEELTVTVTVTNQFPNPFFLICLFVCFVFCQAVVNNDTEGVLKALMSLKETIVQLKKSFLHIYGWYRSFQLLCKIIGS